MTRLEESPEIKRSLEFKINRIKIQYYRSQDTNNFFCKYMGISRFQERWILKNYKEAQNDYKFSYGHYFKPYKKEMIMEDLQ